MSAETDFTIVDGEPARQGRWNKSLAWGALLMLAWTIYEVTARPNLAIVAICTKFGWDDLLTGIWVLRRDPHFGRGRTCFLFYLASAVWRTTVAAMLFSGFLLALLVAMNEKKPGGVLAAAGATVVIGVSLLAIVPLLALISARITGVRVWIDSRTHDSRRTNTWPPVCSSVNFVSNLLFPALLVPIPVTAILSMRLGVIPMLVLMFCEGLLMWFLFRRVAAATPEECWGSALDVLELVDEASLDDRYRYHDAADEHYRIAERPHGRDNLFKETGDNGRRY